MERCEADLQLLQIILSGKNFDQKIVEVIKNEQCTSFYGNKGAQGGVRRLY